MSTTTEPVLRGRLRDLYYGTTQEARRFRFALLGFDILIIAFFIVSSMLPPTPAILAVDVVLAVALMADYAARMTTANRPLWFTLRFTSIVDAIVIMSLLAAFVIDNLGFLRVARMLRLLRSYHVVADLRRVSPWFRRNEEIVTSGINLAVFVFVVTAIVYVVEGNRNPSIHNYFDALYFTVSTLTTTGFGDITLDDTAGRVLSVVIMIFGVSLFLRLIQTIFRPAKLHYPCPDCGLQRHEPDAVHCKHCGHLLKIPTEGD
ncbi:MAG: potassium channel family protein [Rhodospirillales bacterium]